MISPHGGRGHVATLAIPTVAQIADAAASIPSAPYNQLGYSKGPRTFLTITAGAVRISVRDEAKADETRRRARDRKTREIDELVKQQRAWLNEPMALTETPEEAAAARARFRAEVDAMGVVRESRRGKITSWSRKSRARMEFTLRTLDYSPLFEEGRRPAMVTLTMPGKGWESCVPTPRAFKAKLDRFQNYYHRAWGSRPVGVWKMEFQRRGAPHLHILMTPPEGVSRDRLKVEFRAWLSLTWARVVGSTDPVEYAKHVRAGTGVDLIEGERYTDPKRMAQYFSKHGAYASKEYQNDMPQLWAEAMEQGAGGAAFWGYWGLEKATATLELSACALEALPVVGDKSHYQRWTWQCEDAARWATDASVGRAFARDQAPGWESPASDVVKVQRHLRKLARSMAAKRHDGQVVQKINKRGQMVTSMRVRVIRWDDADITTGEIIRRKDYRIGYYTGGSGFLSVNDGRVTADSIARILGGNPAGSKSSYELLA